MEDCLLFEHVITAMKASGIKFQGHEEADAATLQTLCQTSKLLLDNFNCSCLVCIACGYLEMRRGIDGD